MGKTALFEARTGLNFNYEMYIVPGQLYIVIQMNNTDQNVYRHHISTHQLFVHNYELHHICKKEFSFIPLESHEENISILVQTCFWCFESHWEYITSLYKQICKILKFMGKVTIFCSGSVININCKFDPKKDKSQLCIQPVLIIQHFTKPIF